VLQAPSQQYVDTNLVFQIEWVNQYYEKIRAEVGKEMLSQGLNDTYTWLMKQTEPLKKTKQYACASSLILPLDSASAKLSLKSWDNY